MPIINRITVLGVAVVVLCAFFSAPAWAEDAKAPGKLILNEGAYWRHYIRFGLDRLDGAALKTDGEKLLSAEGLTQTAKKAVKYAAAQAVPPATDWRDNAFVWFPSTQWGSGEEAETSNRTPPPPANWSLFNFDDSDWSRARLPLLVGNVLREMSNWGDHDMQQMQVRSAHFRTLFDIPDPTAAGALSLTLTFRGGARVFLNGREIVRAQLPDGDLGPEAVGVPYPADAYVRLADEAPPNDYEKCVSKYGVDLMTDLMGHFDDVFVDAKRPDKREFWFTSMKFGTFTINRKGFDRLTGLRNRTLTLQLPAQDLRKGQNVLAVEIRASDLHPIVMADKNRSWGRNRFLHAEADWSHCRLLGLELRAPAGSAAPSMLTRPAGVQVWAEDPLRRCFSSDFGPVTPGTIHFACAQNGTFSAQLALGTDQELSNLKVTPSPLVREGGGEIPASAFSVSYGVSHPVSSIVKLGQIRCYPDQLANPVCSASEMAIFQHGPVEFRSQRLPRETRLAAMGKLEFFDHFSPVSPQRVPADSCEPVWLSLRVPAAAAPGRYSGVVRVEAKGMKPVDVPVEAEVTAWRVPDARDFQTIMALDLSAYGVARQYKAELWSDAHFKAMEKSFEQLSRAGNDWLVAPLIRNTEFGNQNDTIVRWIRRKDGRLDFDFSRLDRYIELATARWGLPRVICLVVMHGAGRDGAVPTAEVGVLDEASGREEILDVSSNAPDFRGPWKSFAVALQSHGRARGWLDSVYWGFPWDLWGDSKLLPVLSEYAPEIKWAVTSHSANLRGPVSVVSTVTQYRLDVVSKEGWRNAKPNLLNPRSGNQVISTNGNSPPFAFRLMADRALVSGMNGLARLGADYWQDTYFLGAKNFFSGGAAGMPCTYLLWPGAEGAETSQRYEALLEGVQEAEARIFLEQALSGGILPKELADETRRTLLEHNRETLYISAGRVGTQIYDYAARWRERSQRLFAAAAAVALVSGFDVDSQKIDAATTEGGTTHVAIKLRNWTSNPRSWKATVDQPWIKLSLAQGTTTGHEILDITLDAAASIKGATAAGTLTITDVATGRTFPVRIGITVGKSFEFVVPEAYDHVNRTVYLDAKPAAPHVVLNANAGAETVRDFVLTNYSTRPLSFKASASTPWLSTDPPAAEVPPQSPFPIRIKARPPAENSAVYDELLTLTDVGSGKDQKIRVVVHAMNPAPDTVAAPTGPSVFLETLPLVSHSGRIEGRPDEDDGKPFFNKVSIGSSIRVTAPAHTYIAMPDEESIFKIEDSGAAAFSAKVYLWPEHAKQVREGRNNVKVAFEVYVDGKIAAESGLLDATAEPRILVARIPAGAKMLKLVTRYDTPEAHPYLFALWEEPKVYTGK